MTRHALITRAFAATSGIALAMQFLGATSAYGQTVTLESIRERPDGSFEFRGSSQGCDEILLTGSGIGLTREVELFERGWWRYEATDIRGSCSRPEPFIAECKKDKKQQATIPIVPHPRNCCPVDIKIFVFLPDGKPLDRGSCLQPNAAHQLVVAGPGEAKEARPAGFTDARVEWYRNYYSEGSTYVSRGVGFSSRLEVTLSKVTLSKSPVADYADYSVQVRHPGCQPLSSGVRLRVCNDGS